MQLGVTSIFGYKYELHVKVNQNLFGIWDARSYSYLISISAKLFASGEKKVSVSA